MAGDPPLLIACQAHLGLARILYQRNELQAVGRNVKQFQPGDQVFGDLSGCGRGGFAEYVCTPEDVLPAGMTFEDAAAVPFAGMTAPQGLRAKGQTRPGQQVLIEGAGGGVGAFAVQIAKEFGAEVTGVCSTRNVEMECWKNCAMYQRI